MEKKELTIMSKCDGLPLSVTIVEPSMKIKGVVQIAHGMAEHKERYYPFMDYLAYNGYVAVIHDHRGHGKSIKSEEDLGYFYDEKAEYLVSDLYEVTKYIKKKYKKEKLTLFGHSMGSLIVRKYVKTHDDEIDKLIVCGSPSKRAFMDIPILITKIIKKFKGDRYRSEFLQKLVFGKYNEKIKEPISENSWICQNEETVKEYDNDELCGFTFTTNGFLNLFTLMKEVYSKKGWQLKNKELKIYFVAGSRDPVIISKEKWYKSIGFMYSLGYKNIIYKLFYRLRHEILNEEENLVIFTDILRFIDDKK